MFLIYSKYIEGSSKIPILQSENKISEDLYTKGKRRSTQSSIKRSSLAFRKQSLGQLFAHKKEEDDEEEGISDLKQLHY